MARRLPGLWGRGVGPEGGAHRRDVRRRGAAATTDISDAQLGCLAREVREILGSREVEETAFDPRRQSGIRLAGQGKGGVRAHRLQHLERDLRADTAVDTDDVDPSLLEGLDHLGRFLGAQGQAVLREGHLGNDR